MECKPNPNSSLYSMSEARRRGKKQLFHQNPQELSLPWFQTSSLREQFLQTMQSPPQIQPTLQILNHNQAMNRKKPKYEINGALNLADDKNDWENGNDTSPTGSSTCSSGREENMSPTRERSDMNECETLMSGSSGSSNKAKRVEALDPQYLNKRHRNNLAAKKSRELKKRKDSQVELRKEYLERENAVLKSQLAYLMDQNIALQMQLLKHTQRQFTPPDLSQVPLDYLKYVPSIPFPPLFPLSGLTAKK